MEKFKNYIIIGLVALIFILFGIKSCTPDPEPTYIKGKDSIRIDTIPRPYKVVEIKKVYYPKWDTAYVAIGDSIPIIPITRIYDDTSSNDEITILSHVKVKGMIEEFGLKYRLKTPLEIRKTITRTDTLIKAPKISLYGGCAIQGNSSFLDIKPYLNLNYRAKNIHLSYGVFTKSVEIGLGFPLYKSKQ